MTLFEPDLLKPPGRLLLQYDTWEVVSRRVLQNVFDCFGESHFKQSSGPLNSAVHTNMCMLRGIRRYSHCLQRRNLRQSQHPKVKANAWNFGLFQNPVFAMRIFVYSISRIHVDDRPEEAWYRLEVCFRRHDDMGVIVESQRSTVL
jgi:hypothetical protein